jgi:hypothetical protein
MISWEKEGTTALVYGKRDSRFVEIPVTDASRNCERRNVVVSLSKSGGVQAQVELKTAGQRAVELRSELINLTSDERRKSIMAATRDTLPTATIDESSIVIANLKGTAAPLDLFYRFNAELLATRTEKRLLLRPALVSRRDEGLLAEPRRSNSVYFHYPWSESERVIIKAPEGYKAEQLPDPVDIDIGAARYQSTFTLDGADVVYERFLIVNAIIFRVDQYLTVKSFFDRVRQADRTAIPFKQLEVATN